MDHLSFSLSSLLSYLFICPSYGIINRCINKCEIVLFLSFSLLVCSILMLEHSFQYRHTIINQLLICFVFFCTPGTISSEETDENIVQRGGGGGCCY